MFDLSHRLLQIPLFVFLYLHRPYMSHLIVFDSGSSQIFYGNNCRYVRRISNVGSFALIICFNWWCCFTGPLLVLIFWYWCITYSLYHSEQFSRLLFSSGVSRLCSFILFQTIFSWCSFISIRWKIDGLYFFQIPFVIMQLSGFTNSLHLFVRISVSTERSSLSSSSIFLLSISFSFGLWTVTCETFFRVNSNELLSSLTRCCCRESWWTQKMVLRNYVFSVVVFYWLWFCTEFRLSKSVNPRYSYLPATSNIMFVNMCQPV